jgi:hypothetical protein
MDNETSQATPKPDLSNFEGLKGKLIFGGIMFWILLVVYAAFLLFFIYILFLLSPLAFLQGQTEGVEFLQQHPKSCFLIFIILGAGTYLLRRRFLRAYAVIEIVGGISLGWGTFKYPNPNGFLFWAAIMAAIYLLVRGLDNLRVGTEEYKNRRKTYHHGWSTESIESAIKDALKTSVATDVYCYFNPSEESGWRTLPKTHYREIETCELVNTSVSNDLNYPEFRVTVRISRKEKKRNEWSDQRYTFLKESRPWVKDNAE